MYKGRIYWLLPNNRFSVEFMLKVFANDFEMIFILQILDIHSINSVFQNSVRNGENSGYEVSSFFILPTYSKKLPCFLSIDS